MSVVTTGRLVAALALVLAAGASPAAAQPDLGRPAPAFSGKELDGRTIALDDYKGQKNVILVFYVGHR